MLSCKDVTCAYSGHIIFENINITLEGGALVVLHGPNGSGKTSFLQILAGIVNPFDGEVTWNGQEIGAAIKDGEVITQYLGHQYAIKPELTVYENLSFWAKLNGDTSKIPQALDAFGLSDYSERLCAELSNGWKKKVALARLQCCHADMWILDEPYNNLDVKSSEALDDMLSEKSKAGGIIMVSSHTAIPIDFAQKLSISNYTPKNT